MVERPYRSRQAGVFFNGVFFNFALFCKIAYFSFEKNCIETALPSLYRRQPPAPRNPGLCPAGRRRDGSGAYRRISSISRELASPENSRAPPRAFCPRPLRRLRTFPQLSLASSCAILQQPARRRRAPNRPRPAAAPCNMGLSDGVLAEIRSRRHQAPHAGRARDIEAGTGWTADRAGQRGPAGAGPGRGLRAADANQSGRIDQRARTARAHCLGLGQDDGSARSTRRSATPISA